CEQHEWGKRCRRLSGRRRGLREGDRRRGKTLSAGRARKGRRRAHARIRTAENHLPLLPALRQKTRPLTGGLEVSGGFAVEAPAGDLSAEVAPARNQGVGREKNDDRINRMPIARSGMRNIVNSRENDNNVQQGKRG